jgi:PIN domain nuclease of toxin-antitoxin system
MKLLIDTHIAIWLLNGNNSISHDLLDKITEYENQVYISIESIHEIVIKIKRKKIKLKQPIRIFVEIIEKEYGIIILTVNKNHIFELDHLTLKPDHNDPFDHIIISQAIRDKLTLISADQNFSFYEQQGLKLISI